MKRQGRMRIVVFKRLQNGMMDKFEVVIKSDNFQEVKKNYESMGYKVV